MRRGPSLSTKMGIFYRDKAFHTGEKTGKMTLPPPKNYPLTPLVWKYPGKYQMGLLQHLKKWFYH